MSTMKSGLKPVEVMPQNDPLHLIDVDHVRFTVGNAKQAAIFYASMFGFRITQLHDLTCGARSMARSARRPFSCPRPLAERRLADHPQFPGR